jgi:hypothetical protein
MLWCGCDTECGLVFVLAICVCVAVRGIRCRVCFIASQCGLLPSDNVRAVAAMLLLWASGKRHFVWAGVLVSATYSGDAIYFCAVMPPCSLVLYPRFTSDKKKSKN